MPSVIINEEDNGDSMKNAIVVGTLHAKPAVFMKHIRNACIIHN
jgi:hypothetical protein